MGNDGLIFKVLKRVHSRTKTPMIATMLSGLLAAIMALAFDLHQLIDMMSIGTLMAYTVVAMCVLILRYNCPNPGEQVPEFGGSLVSTIIRQLTNFKFTRDPTKLSSSISKIGIIVYSILAIVLCGLLKLKMSGLTITFMSIIGAAMVLVIWIISRQPVDNSVDLTFKVPLVPYLPCISIFINLYLMFQLDGNTWIRFGVWLIVGKLINVGIISLLI